jgi:hypothetical protein
MACEVPFEKNPKNYRLSASMPESEFYLRTHDLDGSAKLHEPFLVGQRYGSDPKLDLSLINWAPIRASARKSARSFARTSLGTSKANSALSCSAVGSAESTSKCALSDCKPAPCSCFELIFVSFRRHRLFQPCARESQITIHGGHRKGHGFRNFFARQAGKICQFQNLRAARILLFQI